MLGHQERLAGRVAALVAELRATGLSRSATAKEVAARTGVDAVNASPLLAALVPDTLTLQRGDPDPDRMREVTATLDGAFDDLARARPSGPQTEAIIEELAVAIGLYGVLDAGVMRMSTSCVCARGVFTV